jgi:hypothetical protein
MRLHTDGRDTLLSRDVRRTPAPSSDVVDGLFAVGFATLLFASAVAALYIDNYSAGRMPIASFAVAFAFGLPALAIAALRRQPWMKVTYAATWAFLFLLFLVPWTPRKRFVSDLHSVQPGMTIEETESIMGSYLRGPGAKWHAAAAAARISTSGGAASAAAVHSDGDDPTRASRTVTYRWNDTDGAYDSDWGCVTFEDGRVVSVEFLAD